MLRVRLENNPDYAKSIVTAYAATFLNIVVQIILVPLYLRYLGKAEFGVLMILLAGINYLSFGVAWASSGAQRIMGEQWASGSPTELNQTYGLVKFIFVGYALLVGLLLIGGSWLVGDLGQGMVEGANFCIKNQTAIAMAIYLVIFFDFNVDRLTLIAIGKQAIANTLAMVAQIIFILCVIPALDAETGLTGIMMAFALGFAACRILSWIVLRRHGIKFQGPRSSDGSTLKRLIGPMGLGYAAYGILLMSLLQGDALLLGWLGDATMVAEFVLIWKIADVLAQMLWRIPETLVPYLVHMETSGDHERLERLYITGQRWMTVTALCVGIAYALFGGAVVELWVGEENAPNNPLAYALAGGCIFWLVSARLPAIFAFSLVRLRPLNMVLAGELAGKVIFTLALFPFIGYLAPLLATNVVHLFGVAYYYRRAGAGALKEARPQTAPSAR